MTGFVVGLFFVFCLISGYSPLMAFQLFAQGRCDLSGQVSEIDFVGHTLRIPVGHIRDCYPIDASTKYDFDPASITLDAILPDMTFVDVRSEDRRVFGPNELRIYLHGSRPDIGKIDPHVKVTKDKLDFSIYTYKNGQRVQAYVEAEKLPNGLIKYRKEPSYPHNLNDAYVYKDGSGEIRFIIRCGKKHSVCGCDSEYEDLFDNVSFKYCFGKDYLPQAIEIDTKVNKLLQEISADSEHVDGMGAE